MKTLHSLTTCGERDPMQVPGKEAILWNCLLQGTKSASTTIDPTIRVYHTHGASLEGMDRVDGLAAADSVDLEQTQRRRDAEVDENLDGLDVI